MSGKGKHHHKHQAPSPSDPLGALGLKEQHWASMRAGVSFPEGWASQTQASFKQGELCQNLCQGLFSHEVAVSGSLTPDPQSVFLASAR